MNLKRTTTRILGGILATMLLVAQQAMAADGAAVGPEDGEPVAAQVEDLKKLVIDINRDMFILEEDLLFPANTQVTVFLSVNTGQFLKLDAVKLKIDEEVVAAHLYTDRQNRALERGGMQRLYTGNLKTGTHEITVFVEGMGPDQREYKQAATLNVEKDSEVLALEIRIQDQSSNYQPTVSLVEWE